MCDVERVEDFYKNIAKGNLYKMFSAKGELELIDKNSPLEDPIELKINKLSYNQKLILGLVCLHDGCIPTNEYNDIFDYVSNRYFINKNDIYTLEGLIKAEQDNTFKVCHASVIDSFNICNENYAALVAYRFLSDYYVYKSSKMSCDISKRNQYMFKLLKLYSVFEPIKILEKIDDFKQLIISSLSEKQAESIIRNIYFSITEDDDVNIRIQIINLAYESGFYLTAYSLLTLLDVENDKTLMLKSMLLNRIDRHDEAILTCKKLFKKNDDPRTRLISKMIRMLSERSQNDEKAYLKTFKSIFNNTKYKDIYEYGFLLRNSQIVFSFSESLKYIKESIDFFEEKKQFKDMACSQLTLAVQNARLGNLREAKIIINQIEDILLDTTFEKHIIYMDKAAISLLDGSANEETLIQLQKSFLSATTSFDKVVILNNQLCWYILHKVDKPMFDKLKRQLDKLLESEPDLRLHRRTFINYSKYFENVLGDLNTAQEFIKNASNIVISNDILGDSFISGKCQDENFIFLSRCPYYVSFITYWHFDLPMS